MTGRPVKERSAVRAILLTPDNEVLLIRVGRPEDGSIFWVTPGGGIEPGETVEAALQREMKEELGLLSYRLGPAVWLRHHIFDWGGERLSQRERYYMVHVERFEARMLDEAEARTAIELRWWKVEDLGSAREPLTPRSLSDIVLAYLESGPPDQLPPEEILIDWTRLGSERS